MPQETPKASQPVATLVPDERRLEFVPKLFGAPFIVAENAVYDLMRWLSPRDYDGGYWDFYELDDRALYLVPTAKPRYRIECPTNGYCGDASSDATGIIVTLFALSHLSFKFESTTLGEAYCRLYEYAAEHNEASIIFGAID